MFPNALHRRILASDIAMTDQRPRLHLHAGTHKTGTTAIQRFAAANRDRLCGQGLLYPRYANLFRTPNESHLALFHAIAGEKSPLGERQLPRLAEDWKRRALDEGLQVLLSAEAIWRHQVAGKSPGWGGKRRAYLQKVSDFLSPFDVQVHVVLRDQDRFVTSSYQENVRKATPAGHLTFMDFASRQLHSSLRYFDNLALLEEIVGPVTVHLYDDLQRDNALIRNFFAAFGVDTSKMTNVGRVRESLSVPQTIVKQYLNANTALGNEDQFALLETPEFVELINTVIGPCSVWPSHEHRDSFLARFAEDNEAVRARWLPATGPLFTYPEWQAPAPNEISPAILEFIARWQKQQQIPGNR